MKKRIAIFGCGFWAHYQIQGWLELDGVEIPAVFNRTRTKAEAVAEKFNSLLYAAYFCVLSR